MNLLRSSLLRRMGIANPYGVLTGTGNAASTGTAYAGVTWPEWTPAGVPKEVAQRAERWMQDIDPCERGAWGELRGVSIPAGADAQLVGSDFCSRELGSRGVRTLARPGDGPRPLHLTEYGQGRDWGIPAAPVVEAPASAAPPTEASVSDIAAIIQDVVPTAPAFSPAASSPTMGATTLLAFVAGGLLLFALVAKKGRR